MSPADKLKLTNMVDQGVGHTLGKLDITDPKQILNEYERFCFIATSCVAPEDADDVREVLNDFLDKKANKLGVDRGQEQKEQN